MPCACSYLPLCPLPLVGGILSRHDASPGRVVELMSYLAGLLNRCEGGDSGGKARLEMWHLQQMHRRAPELQLAAPHPFRIPLNISYLPSEADPVAGPPSCAAALLLPLDHLAKCTDENWDATNSATPGASPKRGSQEGAANSWATATPCVGSGSAPLNDHHPTAKSRLQVTHIVIADD